MQYVTLDSIEGNTGDLDSFDFDELAAIEAQRIMDEAGR